MQYLLCRGCVVYLSKYLYDLVEGDSTQQQEEKNGDKV